MMILEWRRPVDKPGRPGRDLVHLVTRRDVLGGIRPRRMARDVDVPLMVLGLRVDGFWLGAGHRAPPQDLRSVPIVMCGQLRVLKFSNTVCAYCNWVGAVWPWSVSSQNVAFTLTATAFGPWAPPFRKAVFAVPPPGTGASPVVTCSVVVAVMCWPAIAACRTLLGLLTMAWVTPVRPMPEVRKLVFVVRVCSGKSNSGVGWPMVNGLMLVFGMAGATAEVLAVPWATIVVPCGMEASRATVGTTLGLLVFGTATHRPGSMCRPAFRLASEICCR